MYFESIEEQERFESIAERIQFLTEEAECSDYRKCSMKPSAIFEETLADETWDVIAITSLDLHQSSQKGMCRKVRYYKYEINEGNGNIYYTVTKKGNIALFDINQIILNIKL